MFGHKKKKWNISKCNLFYHRNNFAVLMVVFFKVLPVTL